MACLLACVPARAAVPPTVTVSGLGTILRDPDQATLSLSIVTNSNVAASATSANNGLYNALVARMHGSGITAAAIKTTSYDLNFVPKPPPGNNYEPPQTGFIVTRSLSITIDNLSNVGGIIDAAVAAGVTQVSGVNFGLRDERGAHAAALAAAVEDAAAQAAAIAQAAHMRLGTIRNITTLQNAQVFAPQVVRLAVRPPAPVPTEIAPSSIEIQATVTVTYALAP